MRGQEPWLTIRYDCESMYRAHVVLMRQIYEVYGYALSIEMYASLYVLMDAPSINCSEIGTSAETPHRLPQSLRSLKGIISVLSPRLPGFPSEVSVQTVYFT
ncbi:hypothetical protein EVAR_87610_1 [Eumeta japonica]|uniref:Uncharacterized protein n=1 Tax=Eumeta variegata TaxID=151549 RepID=A0A4C1WQ48_EUMVA|nr:hypothetical protein EVAR_87610_1 [Eumeta japonica]